jgi:hypothetical protein
VASPTGDTYTITRYVYRTVVDLSPGMVLLKKGDGAQEGEDVVLKGDTGNAEMILHPGWAGQLVIETDGTTEAAESLLQRATTPISREIKPNQPRPSMHINNRPYRILRNMSRPGLIFCRVVQDAPLPQPF